MNIIGETFNMNENTEPLSINIIGETFILLIQILYMNIIGETFILLRGKNLLFLQIIFQVHTSGQYSDPFTVVNNAG